MCRRPQLLMILSCLVVLGCQDTESSPASDGASASETEVLSDGVAEVDAGPQLPPLAVEELAIVEPGGETICSRGTDFRFFALGGDAQKIIIDFDGGGACWNAATCSVADAIFSPEAPSTEQIEAMVSSGYRPGLYHLDQVDNPFAGWTLVHIPYCTGDIHWGDNVVDYSDDLRIHHKGLVNFQSVMEWITARYPNPSHVMVTGCSAGAYGAIGAAPQIQELWPDAKLTVLADSGAGIITESFFQDSFPNWNASAAVPWWLPEMEGKTIADLDIVELYSAIVNGLPGARVAQYNTAYDKDQTFYYDVMGGEAADWSGKLRETLATITSRAPGFRHYLAPGPIHCIHPYEFFYERVVEGVSYADWLYELAHGEEPPDTVQCQGDGCLDDPLCAACNAGTNNDPGCGWCDGWAP